MSKTTLIFKKIELMSADIGKENPMPDLKNVSYIHAKYETSNRLTAEDTKHFGKGMIDTILPYLSQDNYNRDIKKALVDAAILENDNLKAVFLPGLGGRLWSLYDKKTERELLYVNDFIQPANLALRNAWVAGGVEWNVGIKGHNPLTCSPMFAAESENDKGEPILSLYEFERKREIVYGINAYIPDDGDTLYIRTTIENKTNKTPYTYWWSNIAVPEDGIRILTDAEQMISCVYEDNHYSMDKMEAPYFAGIDSSYAKQAPYAGDLFYILEKDNRKKWIASLDEEGTGLLQYSTPELLGRKVFFWGKGQGGRNWNKFLTYSDKGYIEIQAGLLRTQMEHIPMEPNSTLSWTECYTLAKNARVKGDWREVSKEMASYVDSLPDPALADIPLNKKKVIKYMGSGWGSICENKISDFYEFPKTAIDELQDDWIHLSQKGYLPYNDGSNPPISYMVNKETLSLLEKSLSFSEAEHWYTYLHLGIARYVYGDVKGAEVAWLTSYTKKPTPWNSRNLAVLYKNIIPDSEKAIFYATDAAKLSAYSSRELLSDCASVFVECGTPQKWIDIYNNLSNKLKLHGRLKMYAAIGYKALGDKIKARELINEDFEMSDIKEGELSISAVWNDLYGDEKPLPQHLNFRMHEK